MRRVFSDVLEAVIAAVPPEQTELHAKLERVRLDASFTAPEMLWPKCGRALMALLHDSFGDGPFSELAELFAPPDVAALHARIDDLEQQLNGKHPIPTPPPETSAQPVGYISDGEYPKPGWVKYMVPECRGIYTTPVFLHSPSANSAELDRIHDRLAVFVDEEFGMQPVMTTDELIDFATEELNRRRVAEQNAQPPTPQPSSGAATPLITKHPLDSGRLICRGGIANVEPLEKITRCGECPEWSRVDIESGVCCFGESPHHGDARRQEDEPCFGWPGADAPQPSRGAAEWLDKHYPDFTVEQLDYNPGFRAWSRSNGEHGDGATPRAAREALARSLGWPGADAGETAQKRIAELEQSLERSQASVEDHRRALQARTEAVACADQLRDDAIARAEKAEQERDVWKESHAIVLERAKQAEAERDRAVEHEQSARRLNEDLSVSLANASRRLRLHEAFVAAADARDALPAGVLYNREVSERYKAARSALTPEPSAKDDTATCSQCDDLLDGRCTGEFSGFIGHARAPTDPVCGAFNPATYGNAPSEPPKQERTCGTCLGFRQHNLVAGSCLTNGSGVTDTWTGSEACVQYRAKKPSPSPVPAEALADLGGRE